MGRLLERYLDAHRHVPRSALRALLLRLRRGAGVHLCLHRVCGGEVSPGDTTIPEPALDELMYLLGADQSLGDGSVLAAHFDDGYADAADYVRRHISTLPAVRWYFHVCPEKARARAGFRWDSSAAAETVFGPPFEPATENQRESLRGLADAPASRLATVEELTELRDRYGVILGNHTNCHFPLLALEAEQAEAELVDSARDFQSLWGHTEHFAFPFGVPQKHFGPQHVTRASALGYRRFYTTEPRPHFDEGHPAPLLIPRFAVFGTWPARRYALFIATILLREQLRRRVRRVQRRSP